MSVAWASSSAMSVAIPARMRRREAVAGGGDGECFGAGLRRAAGGRCGSTGRPRLWVVESQGDHGVADGEVGGDGDAGAGGQGAADGVSVEGVGDLFGGGGDELAVVAEGDRRCGPIGANSASMSLRPREIRSPARMRWVVSSESV